MVVDQGGFVPSRRRDLRSALGTASALLAGDDDDVAAAVELLAVA